MIKLLSLLLLFSCVSEKAKYAYVVDLDESNRELVSTNAVCNTFAPQSRGLSCYEEGSYTKCVDSAGIELIYKVFNTKSVCDSEVSVKKREAIDLN